MREKWITISDVGKRPLYIAPVCNPSGVIKYVRLSLNITSAIIQAEYDEHERLRLVSLRSGLSDKGWSMLADLFHEDGLEPAWDAFRKWMLSTNMGTGEGNKVKPFPAKYLPQGILDRRAGVALHQAEPDEITIPELDSRPAHTSKRKARAAGLEIAG
jgi:hypothetical protein